MLIAAFKVHVARPSKPEFFVQHRDVRHSRVKPDIKNVAVLLDIVRAAFVAAGFFTE